jgi:DNA replication protein DnaD
MNCYVKCTAAVTDAQRRELTCSFGTEELVKKFTFEDAANDFCVATIKKYNYLSTGSLKIETEEQYKQKSGFSTATKRYLKTWPVELQELCVYAKHHTGMRGALLETFSSPEASKKIETATKLLYRKYIPTAPKEIQEAIDNDIDAIGDFFEQNGITLVQAMEQYGPDSSFEGSPNEGWSTDMHYKRQHTSIPSTNDNDDDADETVASRFRKASKTPGYGMQTPFRRMLSMWVERFNVPQDIVRILDITGDGATFDEYFIDELNGNTYPTYEAFVQNQKEDIADPRFPKGTAQELIKYIDKVGFGSAGCPEYAGIACAIAVRNRDWQQIRKWGKLH